MTTINSLSQIDALGGGDQVPVYDSDAGTARKASVSQFVAYFRSAFASPDVAVTISSPIAGFNQVLATSATSIWLILTPAGTLATGTVTLPPVADCFDGQQVLVTSTESITALTVAGNGATVNGAPAALGIDGFFALRFNRLLSSWYCVSQSLGALGTSFGSITLTDFPALIKDEFGNTLLALVRNAINDVNYLSILAKPTGGSPNIVASGSDTDIDISISAKGTGDISLVTTGGGDALVDGDVIVTLTASQSLTNKTFPTYFVMGALTFSALPAPSVSLVGARAFIIDAAATFASGVSLNTNVAGGGANKVPVFCDGTNWKYG
jgi:hypothetical protein